MNSPYSRRDLLKHGILLASASVTVPAFLSSSATAMAQALGGLSSAPGIPDERILVVVQLSGGNDGLNTVVPHFAPEYYRLRPGIAVQQDQLLRLSGADGIGLHPAMEGLMELYDDGLLSIVQGVGYPNPDRSHFKSMDIWHTADVSATGNGWLGRYLDSECCGFGKGESGTPDAAPGGSAGPASVAIGRSAPLALEGSLVKPVAFESADLFRWSGREVERDLADPYDALNRRDHGAEFTPLPGARPASSDGTNADFLVRTALDAQVSSDLIRKAVERRPRTTFPQSELGRQLSMVSSMIHAGLKTRVYYVSLGGFDTHAGQGGSQGRHAQLLRGYSDAVLAFWKEMKLQENDRRVLMMTFSEFGRRVGQNASQGTDHGTAAPMFLLGPMVRPGVIADHPSLANLDEGDMRFGVDFRAVYAGILGGWLKADASKVIDGSPRAVELLKT